VSTSNVRVRVCRFDRNAEREGKMRNGECVLGLAERDEYIIFQNYIVLIVMKRCHFDFFFYFLIFFLKNETK
jgi:hypothetical protein